MPVVQSLRQFMSGTRKDASAKPPILLSWRSSKFFIVLTVCLALFTDIFYYALIVPVVPFSLTVQVGLAEDQVQRWTSILLACYSLALFVGSPIAGIYADHTSSRRWPLLLGLVALAASTLLLCFGRSIGLLVLGRLLQGFSAAIVWSVGCALLVDTMESAVGMAMGYVATAMSIALLIAPAVGGAVYAAAGYYAVYYIAFGVVLVDILLRLVMIEKKVAHQWSIECVTPSTPGPDHDVEKTAAANPHPSGQEGTRRAGNVPPLATETAASTASALLPMDPQNPTAANGPDSHGLHGKQRPIWTLLKSTRLLAALYAIVVQAGIMMGFDAILALFVQSTFGWNSTAAGLMFIAVFLPGFISPLVGWLADRYGAKWPSFAGFVVIIPTVICLRFVTENTIGHKVLLTVLLAITGVALSFSNTPLMAEITYVIVQKDKENPGLFGEKGVYGMGYGLFTMAFAAGGVVGPLWAGYVNDSAGWGATMWSLSLWAASAAVVVIIWLGDTKPQQKNDQVQDNADVGGPVISTESG
ncbi:vesicular amine transporter [Seiridium cupressi]